MPFIPQNQGGAQVTVGGEKKEETGKKMGKSSVLKDVVDVNATIKVERVNGLLSKETVKDVLNVILIETRRQLPQMNAKTRKARRELLDKPEEYAKSFQDSLEEFNQLVARVSEQSCEAIKITPEEYMASFEELVRTGNEDIVVLQASIAQLMR